MADAIGVQGEAVAEVQAAGRAVVVGGVEDVEQDATKNEHAGSNGRAGSSAPSCCVYG